MAALHFQPGDPSWTAFSGSLVHEYMKNESFATSSQVVLVSFQPRKACAEMTKPPLPARWSCFLALCGHPTPRTFCITLIVAAQAAPANSMPSCRRISACRSARAAI